MNFYNPRRALVGFVRRQPADDLGQLGYLDMRGSSRRCAPAGADVRCAGWSAYHACTAKLSEHHQKYPRATYNRMYRIRHGTALAVSSMRPDAVIARRPIDLECMNRMSYTIYAAALQSVINEAGFDDELARLITLLARTNPVALRGHSTIIPTAEIQGELGIAAVTAHEQMLASLALRAAVIRLRDARWQITIGTARPGGPVLDLVEASPDRRFLNFRFSDRFLAYLRHLSMYGQADPHWQMPL